MTFEDLAGNLEDELTRPSPLEIKDTARKATQDRDAAYMFSMIVNAQYESNRIYRGDVTFTPEDAQNCMRMVMLLIQVKRPLTGAPAQPEPSFLKRRGTN